MSGAMGMLALAAALGALALWGAVLLARGGAHRLRERLEPSPGLDPSTSDLSAITVLIPARDEAQQLGRTLGALIRQGRDLEILLVDDRSSDGTAAAAVAAVLGAGAARAAGPGAPALTLRVLPGRRLAQGWGGKLWALEQGLAHVRRRYTLLLDADIELAPGTIARLLEHAEAERLGLVSIMARLNCAGAWERLLVPPFVFFFKLLYPFAWVNDERRKTAAAAGGCILAETAVLRGVGAFAAIREALIDDCALAARVKAAGHRIWLGLSLAVRSRRRYTRLRELWAMVARTAFTQLRYSAALLAAVSLVMLLAFVVPVAVLVRGPEAPARLAAAAALLVMGAVYWPMVRFYGLPGWWTATLPVAAALYLMMTWSSAVAYWRGVRATWKDRTYGVSS